MLRKWFTTNRNAKIGSMLLAIGVWSFAVSGATRTDVFPGAIPISLAHVPANLAASLSVSTVQVRISAQAALWRQLSPSSFAATIDLSNLGPGTSEVPVQATSLVPNVQLVDVIPRTVVVQLEPVTTKNLPVQVRTDGTPAAGYFPSDATTDPATVSVRGPESVVNQLSHVTAVVDVNGASTNKDSSATLQVIDDSGHALTSVAITPNTATVHQPLTKLAATKTVGIQVVTTGTPTAGKLVSPKATKPVTVTIAGGQSQVSSITTIATKPIDVSGFTQDTTVKSSLDVPAGITVIDQSSIDVSFSVTNQQSTRSIGANLAYSNLPADRHVVSADPAAPTVVVTGSADVLAKLAGSDVVLTIDLSGAVAGTKQIVLSSAQLTLPPGVTLQQLATTAITLIIQ